jgi:hypothetical protein
MPATSQEPSGRFASRSEFQTGGSGRRKRVSARHQVKRLHRHSAGFALTKTGSAEEAQYPYWRSSFGADPKVRSFTGGFRRLRFGPDVFADALVAWAGAWSLGGLINKIPEDDRSEPSAA